MKITFTLDTTQIRDESLRRSFEAFGIMDESSTSIYDWMQCAEEQECHASAFDALKAIVELSEIESED